VTPEPRVLVLSEDDDVAEPLAALLGRAGYAVDVADGRDGARILASGRAPCDALILDHDLPPEQNAKILELLAPSAGPASFPLLVLGGGPSPAVPAGWHEDAFASLSRPPQPGEVLASLAFLRRLVFYRRYRDLVHDLAQPVTTIHALSRSIATLRPDDEAARQAIDRFAVEAERLMVLLEAFQRSRGPSTS
jgi:DNA-binding response OmpR family regulator